MRIIKGQKYVWQLPTVDQALVYQLGALYNLSLPIVETLVGRGFNNRALLDSYLFTSFENAVHHASKLKDAEKAVERIIYALKHRQKILIFGDYDVDGITSSAMMMLCLQPLGAQVNFYVPHRVHDGYGLSKKIVERAARNGYKLIITVDNGIAAHEPVLYASELGVDVIITDHHRPQGAVPNAYAVINPHQQDCVYPFKYLAGVGVTFKLLSLLYEQLGKELPAKVYELLLLGTIADVVPLQGENRFWVRYGLQQINTTESFALRVLKENAKYRKQRISATDIGFAIAPQINALGRLEDPRQGVKFLISGDQAEVAAVGKVLFELNEARKDIERAILTEIEQEILTQRINIIEDGIIIAESSNWPPGVIGLVASRLVALYGKPAILLHKGADGIAKGSCRSIPAFNIFDALEESRDLLITFGGHSLAAGLSLPVINIRLLKERLNKRIKKIVPEHDLQPKIVLDAELKLPDANKKLVADLEYLEPFGNENRQPVFYLKGVTLVGSPTVLKDVHVKCMMFADGVLKPLIFFNRPDLIPVLQEQGGEPFDCAVQVIENHWNGRTNIELLGIDVAR